ncbi:tigger transposable element-derived protein 1-like [Homalodisca vitripennis]|uniref:tigger transposable element-derived protein 1-like n=1 Tax=Homalodisca vitripennis TaxID=197043 RepID=UPI001EEC7A8B|nr:tigger transposable element-derived protein 1-like [Homalodisca vitripennis]
MSADSIAAAEYLQEFKEITSSYSPQQVYNADETGLNFKALPTKSLASREEKSAPGFKMDKQRLTVLACSNASATNKIPLMVIEAWENTSVGALQKSWKNLWPDLQFVEEVVPPVNECELLPLVKKIPGCENVEKECVDEWTAVDDKGFEEYTDEDIVA